MKTTNRTPSQKKINRLSAELQVLLEKAEAAPKPARHVESPAERIARIHAEAMARS